MDVYAIDPIHDRTYVLDSAFLGSECVCPESRPLPVYLTCSCGRYYICHIVG